MRIRTYLIGILTLGGILSGTGISHAQDYDDIYYNPSKEKKQPKKEVKVTRSTTTTRTTTTYTPTPDYKAAGDYQYSTGSTRDVDEYNRHSSGTNLNDFTIIGDTVIDGEEFMYTRRIERFHNPDVVVNTNDDDLIDYYYSAPTSSTVNVYVDANPWVSPYYWNTPYYSYPYYNSWSWGWNGPWYNYWGPSFSWGWSDPWYSWSWGPSFGWNWGWNSPWYPGPSYGWTNNWWPTGTSGGSSRPHPSTSRPAYGGGITSTGNNYGSDRPGSGAGTITGNTPTTRPGNMGRGRYTNTGNSATASGATSVRPSTGTISGTNRWPASVNTPSASSGSTRRGRVTTTPSATTERQPSTNTRVNTRTNYNNYNNNNTRSTYSPASSSRSTYNSSGFGGGGSRSTGASSGSRGRR